jgi:hypothetical protein
LAAVGALNGFSNFHTNVLAATSLRYWQNSSEDVEFGLSMANPYR